MSFSLSSLGLPPAVNQLANGLLGIGSDFVTVLGTVAFFSFEVPAELNDGGAQSLKTHKYPGGSRTIDTMGPDDDVITWSGFFEGGSAESRWDQINVMRAAGVAVPLTWSTRTKTVVVKTATIRYRRYYHIGYTISCEVLQDLTQPVPPPFLDLDMLLQSDAAVALNDAVALAVLF
jgi:hypothetical protein